LAICAKFGREIWDSVELDRRSDAFEHHVDASLMSSPAQAGELFPLIDDVINRHAAFICVVPPYALEIRGGANSLQRISATTNLGWAARQSNGWDW
jgi:hypothetical protein